MVANKDTVRVAAVQAASPNYDLIAGVEKTICLIQEARDKGCDLIAFGEAWLPGYPFHIWLGAPAWGMQYVKRYFDNSLEIGSAEYQKIADAARDCGIHVALGYSERCGGSLFLGQCLISDQGELISARRKLKPTHVERTVFGEGYGKDLVVPATALGKIGLLCCWEHLQPLSKYALYSQEEAIHIAAWPSFCLYKEMAYALGADVNMAASRIYSVEGQCFTVAATSVITQSTLDLLQVNEETASLLQVGGGASMIFGPDGRQLAEYLPEIEEGLVIADLSMAQITYAKAAADPAGHYSKPDVTRLILDLGDRTPVSRINERHEALEPAKNVGTESADADVDLLGALK